MSAEVRKNFVYGHLLYVFSHIVTCLPYLGFSYFILYATTVLQTQTNSVHYEEIANDERFSN